MNCDLERCYCHRKGHFCEPDRYPKGLGEHWTCPECGLLHESFDVLKDGRLPDVVRKHLIAKTFGWKSVPASRDPRPCEGGNTNICVGEGCYGEACLGAKS